MTAPHLNLPIYLDYQATTPLDPRALDAMMPYLTDQFGNPHSSTHAHGWQASDAIERARSLIASLIGASSEEIYFQSGATEANNLIIKGIYRAYGGYRNHVVTVATEHKCVLESVVAIQDEGAEVTILGVTLDGLIDLAALETALTDNTLMVTVMAVNNEIGVIQPLADIGALCRERKILFHTDAAQAAGKIVLDVDAMQIDAMSLSGHKIYGPKGIGALYLRKGARLRPKPVISGGGQEGGLRSGTLSPALCVGMGAAFAIADEQLETDREKLDRQFKRLVDKILDKLEGVTLNGSRERRFPGNINLSFAGVDSALLLTELRELSISSGAACASAVEGPSYVLAALGVPEKLAQATLRIGIGRPTTDAEIDYAADSIVVAVNKLRTVS